MHTYGFDRGKKGLGASDLGYATAHARARSLSRDTHHVDPELEVEVSSASGLRHCQPVQPVSKPWPPTVINCPIKLVSNIT